MVKNVKKKSVFFLICSIFIVGVLFFSTEQLHGASNNKDSYQKFQTYKSNKAFNKIYLDVYHTDIEVKKGSSFKVRFTTNRPMENFQVENNTLKIVQKKADYNVSNYKMPKLTIIVPQKTAIKNLTIIKAAYETKLFLKDLKLEEVELASGADTDVILENMTISKSLKTSGGQFLLKDSLVNDWRETRADDGSKYEINNSKLKTADIKGKDYIILNVTRSEIIGKINFISKGITEAKIRKSKLNNLKIKGADLTVKMKDSTLVGKNEIDGDAQINLKKINQDIGINIQGDSVKGSVYGTSIKSDFTKRSSSTNHLDVIGDEVYINLR